MTPEQNTPDVPQWIIDEAHDDPVLIDLIGQREWLLNNVADKGGLHALLERERAAVEASKQTLDEAIAQRKEEVGIEPPQE